jgi:hypothetical protein
MPLEAEKYELTPVRSRVARIRGTTMRTIFQRMLIGGTFNFGNLKDNEQGCPSRGAGRSTSPLPLRLRYLRRIGE